MVTLPGGAVELTAARIWAADGTLFCTLTARAVEGKPQKEELEVWGQKVLEAALAAGWDCWSLDRELGALRPGDWEVWKDYPVNDLVIKVTGKVVRP